METVHWGALVIGILGAILIAVGISQQRAATPSNEIAGGFGGPAGSSDVGTADGFAVPAPHEHYRVGRTWRLLGLALVLIALGLLGYSWLV